MTERCRSCGAEITWELTDNGRKVPMNRSTEKRFVRAAGGRMQIADTYVSHFVTCPDAASWRGGKSGSA